MAPDMVSLPGRAWLEEWLHNRTGQVSESGPQGRARHWLCRLSERARGLLQCTYKAIGRAMGGGIEVGLGGETLQPSPTKRYY